MNFNACQILLLVIGEESKKINDTLKQEYAEIPWHLIASLGKGDNLLIFENLYNHS